MGISESYLQSLLAQITAQGGVPPTYIPKQRLGVGHNLNLASRQVPEYSALGSSSPRADMSRRRPLEPRNLFDKYTELLGVK